MPKRKGFIGGVLEDFLKKMAVYVEDDIKIREKKVLWQLPKAFSVMLKDEWKTSRLDLDKFYRAVKYVQNRWGWTWQVKKKTAAAAAAAGADSPDVVPFSDMKPLDNSPGKVKRRIIREELSARPIDSREIVTHFIERMRMLSVKGNIEEALARREEHDKVAKENFKAVAASFGVFFTSPKPPEDIEPKYMFCALLIAILATITTKNSEKYLQLGSVKELYPSLLTIINYLIGALNRLTIPADSPEAIVRVKSTQMMAEIKSNLSHESSDVEPARYLW
jgi:hypothetical protein